MIEDSDDVNYEILIEIAGLDGFTAKELRTFNGINDYWLNKSSCLWELFTLRSFQQLYNLP